MLLLHGVWDTRLRTEIGIVVQKRHSKTFNAWSGRVGRRFGESGRGARRDRQRDRVRGSWHC